MNGGFAATFLQRPPPPGLRIPLRGHGLRDVAPDPENPTLEQRVSPQGGPIGSGKKKGSFYSHSNPGSDAQLLRHAGGGGGSAHGSAIELAHVPS